MNAPCIVVSGLHRSENPQPGAGIIRSLRRVWPGARIIGLVYDVMESGIYAGDGPDDVVLMPYPAAGAASFFQRLDALRRSTPVDLLIPSLDAEIELLVHLQKDLTARGIRFCLPDPGMLRRRSKQFLPALAETCGVAVPETRVAHDVIGAGQCAVELGLPLIMKGPYYDALTVCSVAHAQAAAAHLLAEWGGPVILQRRVVGPEFNVLGIGDGRGKILAQCSVRKTVISEKGKGLGAIVVRDERLDRLCEDLIRELRWNGPFEIELIRDSSRDRYVLIEINPRFPAWIDFPAILGTNFAAALVDLMRGVGPIRPLPACQPGSFFLRHQVEVAGNINRYAGLLQDDNASSDPLSVDSIPAPQPSTAVLP